jgi:hypothetical protein
MDDQYIKPAEFARLVGISRQGVADAISKGLIPAVEIDGKNRIDLNDQHVKDYMRNRDKKPVEVVESKQVDITKPVEVSKIKKQKTNKPDKVTDPEIPEYLKDIADNGELSFEQMMSLSKSEVDKIKSYEMIKSIKQKREKDRRELVDIKFIKLVFGKIYDIDVNEFMALKTRVKSALAKVFETNDDIKLLAAEKEIDIELWDTLARIKFEFNKFLEKMKSEKL